MKKIIFGKSFQFECDRYLLPSLSESIRLYPDTCTAETNVLVKVKDSLCDDTDVLSVNPAIHKKTKNGMVIRYGRADIRWSKLESGCIQVELFFKPISPLKKLLYRYRSIEFPRDVEIFEQILHELVLIPSVYFFLDIAPVHAACVQTLSGGVLLAGTGGVGKSSSLLALRNEPSLQFVSDDIAVVSDDGKAFGNMAWPKIYGYNCVGSTLKNEILKGRGGLDFLHFHIRNSLNSSAVRRKVSPDRLFNDYEADFCRLSKLYYLIREDAQDIEVSTLDLDDAVNMTLAVILTEYTHFHNSLHWERYNSIATGKTPILSFESVLSNWRIVLENCFSPLKRYKISIPLQIDHDLFQERIQSIILNDK